MSRVTPTRMTALRTASIVGVCASAFCSAVLAATTPPISAPIFFPASGTSDLDPTEIVEITGWWTNEREVLYMRDDGAFYFWDQPNRFRAVSKSGRWDHQNYRTFWLEPYFDPKTPGRSPPRVRAAMRRVEGVLMASLEIAKDLRRVESAPTAPEDSYVGRWIGPGGSLQLDGDGTYELHAAANTDPDAPLISRSGHRGTWSCNEQYIFLSTAGPSSERVICTIVDRSDPAPPNSPEPAKTFEALTTPIGELRPAPKDPAAKDPAASVPAPTVRDPKASPAPR